MRITESGRGPVRFGGFLRGAALPRGPASRSPALPSWALTHAGSQGSSRCYQERRGDVVRFFRYLAPVAAFAVLVPGTVFSQESVQDAQDQTAQDQNDADKPEGDAIEEVIVVTASRTEQRLQEVPVAMTVISAEQLATTPADNYGDVLRSVPGLNVSQISARDIQISGRGATSSLATDQLVLLDGRSVYLDFFGFVMWDLLPVDFREIAQIEVVRGAGPR